MLNNRGLISIRTALPRIKRAAWRAPVGWTRRKAALWQWSQGTHVLHAVARAWIWRRKIERGEASTRQDIATIEKVTDSFVSRMMPLTDLAPDVLEKLLIHRIAPALSLNDPVAVAELPWAEQMEAVFGSASGSTL